MNDIERRTLGAKIELRMDGEGEAATPRIVGYAAVFNSLSEDLGGFREKIAPGAFKGSMDADVRALFNHDPSLILGRSRSGTLRMTEDQHGLAVEIDPPNTAAARSIMEALKRGDVDQMSFGFRTLGDAWDRSGDEIVRTLTAVELLDVSVVTYPAYPATEAAVRSLNAWEAKNAPPEPEFINHDMQRRRLDLMAL